MGICAHLFDSLIMILATYRLLTLSLIPVIRVQKFAESCLHCWTLKQNGGEFVKLCQCISPKLHVFIKNATHSYNCHNMLNW